MKLITLVGTFACLSLTAFAQTNTFPATGSAGIGTTTPAYKLHILDNAPNTYTPSSTTLFLPGGVLFQASNVDLSNTKGAFITTNAENAGGINQSAYFGSVSNASGFAPDIVIGQRTGNTAYDERMRIAANGNVSIGLASTTLKLEANGPIGAVNGIVTSSNVSTGGFQLSNNSKVLRWIIRGLNNEAGSNNGYDLDIQRRADDGSGLGTALYIRRVDGNIGIGTASPGTNKLAVEGTIAARRVKVTQAANWPDFVFDPGYQLPSLMEVESYVKANQHLPEMPSAEEVTAEGQDLGEMNRKLLQKVEELTLYIIEQQKAIQAQDKRIQQLESRMKK